jgi:hypothetical protein
LQNVVGGLQMGTGWQSPSTHASSESQRRKHSPQFRESLDVSTQSPSHTVSSHPEPVPASPPTVLTLLPPHAIADRAKNASAMDLETHIPEVEMYHA